MANFCNNCGANLGGDAKFCPGCGTNVSTPPPLAAAPAYAAPSAPVYAAPTASVASKNNLPWIIAGLATLAMVVLVSYLLFSRPATGTAGTAAMAAGAKEGEALGPEVIKFVNSEANIRSMATARGEESKIVGSVKRGNQVKGTMHMGLSGDAHWFKLADGRGYISAVNLGDAPTVVAAAPAAPPARAQVRAAIGGASYCTVATNSGNLRIRATPNGRIIGGLPKGARFQAFGQQADEAGGAWVQIQPVELRYPVGWASAAYVAC